MENLPHILLLFQHVTNDTRLVSSFDALLPSLYLALELLLVCRDQCAIVGCYREKKIVGKVVGRKITSETELNFYYDCIFILELGVCRTQYMLLTPEVHPLNETQRPNFEHSAGGTISFYKGTIFSLSFCFSLYSSFIFSQTSTLYRMYLPLLLTNINI